MGISTHMLDTAAGRPAVGVSLRLERWTGESWLTLNEAVTDEDGRCKYLLPAGEDVTPGRYRVRFKTAPYYEGLGLHGLYPYVDVVFSVTSAQEHYHVPLLLTANGYTTYRGS